MDIQKLMETRFFYQSKKILLLLSLNSSFKLYYIYLKNVNKGKKN